ncbi:MAG TPA: hypothetical protein VM241_00090 [Candidatus Thermoplasmatota archaeon]|nr:hypothetical protein [Candidatus Thermoplasmatota archaeon]
MENRKAARNVLRLVERLSSRGGRAAMASTFVFLFLAIVTVPLVGIAADSDGCHTRGPLSLYDGECGDLRHAFGVAGAVLVVLEIQASLLCATLWATQASEAHRRRQVAADTALRLQLAKQIYAAGRIGGADFMAFKAKANPFIDGSHEALARRYTGGALVALGLVATPIALLLAPYSFTGLTNGFDCPSCTGLAASIGWTAGLIAVADTLLLAGLAFFGLALGFPLQRAANRRLAEERSVVVQDEERLLALANRNPGLEPAPLVRTRR